MTNATSSCTQITLQPISVAAAKTNGKGPGKIIPRLSPSKAQFNLELSLNSGYMLSQQSLPWDQSSPDMATLLRSTSPHQVLAYGCQACCRQKSNEDELPPRFPAWLSEGNVQAFDVRQPQALYAAWDVFRSSKPACLLHTPLIAHLVSKWTPEYLASNLPATALHMPYCDTSLHPLSMPLVPRHGLVG